VATGQVTQPVRAAGGAAAIPLTTVAYAATASPSSGQPCPAGRPAARALPIENGVHHSYRGDVIFGKDASQVRTGTAPQVMACLRNPAIGVLCRAGPVNLAAALRFHSRDPHRPLATLGISLG
jgi:hypothetical protein